MKCEPRQFSVTELVQAWTDASLRINHEYQRGAKWTEGQKQGLVDSIFRKYPIPPMFLHELKAVGLGGNSSTRFEVVDGQQRIRALADYFEDKFALLDAADRKLKLPNSLRSIPAQWGKKRFSELLPEHRAFLQGIEIDVFVITEVDRPDEVRDLFIRLQSGTALSRQQIRDAWPGNIGPYIERLAGKLSRGPSIKLFQLADKRGTSIDDDRDRYDADRHFCAQLLALFLARENDPCAIQSVGPNDLDNLYHEHTEFDPTGPGAARFESILAHATTILEVAQKKAAAGPKAKRKFKKLDIISSVLFAQDVSKNKFLKIDNSFYKAVAHHVLTERDGARQGKSTSGPAIIQYYEEWRSDLVPGLGIQLDPIRIFTDQQRIEIFERDNGLCKICNKAVDDDDAEYDHFPLAHAVGGKTLVDNGRLVHKACHPRGRPVSQLD
jgi:hypothetical protein